jgi:hypothetical protein
LFVSSARTRVSVRAPRPWWPVPSRALDGTDHPGSVRRHCGRGVTWFGGRLCGRGWVGALRLGGRIGCGVQVRSDVVRACFVLPQADRAHAIISDRRITVLSAQVTAELAAEVGPLWHETIPGEACVPAAQACCWSRCEAPAGVRRPAPDDARAPSPRDHARRSGLLVRREPKWKTLSRMPRSAMPPTKRLTVASSSRW